MRGGGVKGIACIGAMQVLAQRNLLEHVLRVGGTSAGAINALIYALGYSIPEQLAILRSTEFKLPDEKKDALLKQGVCGAETYFAWFENSAVRDS